MTRDWRRAAVLAVALASALAGPLAQAQLFGGDETARKQIAEQGRRLEALRLQKDSMPEETYLQELERLLLELASVAQRIEERSRQ